MDDVKTTEARVSRGFRIRESVMLMLAAASVKDGDPDVNATAEKAFEEYSRQRLAA